MTNDRAKEVLKAWNLNHSDEFTVHEFDEAFRMAIKALEQQPTAKNNLGVDCISRKQAIEEADNLTLETGYDNEKVVEMLNDLPSVTPQEPKIGHWIVEKGSYLGMRNGHCSCCKDYYTNDWNEMNYCPNCGARMIEPQAESEES